MSRRARRTTQPLLVRRRRDPTIRALGFGCFRLLKIPGRADFAFVPSTGRNAMAAFARLAS